MIARSKLAALSMAGVALFGLSACGGEAEEATPAATESSAPNSGASPSESSEAPMESSAETMAPAAAGAVGPGCADYAAAVPEGAGSVQGMAMDPVATAASNNPLLTTLVAAVSGKLNPDVNLVSTLNGDQFTVFAPVDDAFAKVDPATVETLKTDSALLTKVLTYHVVPGQIGLDGIVGTHTTVEGQDVDVAGTPENLTVNGSSAVICGGVKTANATVYLVDSVLMPPA